MPPKGIVSHCQQCSCLYDGEMDTCPEGHPANVIDMDSNHGQMLVEVCKAVSAMTDEERAAFYAAMGIKE